MERDRIFFAYVEAPQVCDWGNPVGTCIHSLGHRYRLMETRCEAQGSAYFCTAALAYLGKDVQPGDAPLDDFVSRMSLRELDPDDRATARAMRMTGAFIAYPIDKPKVK